MIQSKRARIFAGPLSAALLGAAALMGSVTGTLADGDEPPVLSEDVSEEEVRPPNGSDEAPGDRRDVTDRSTEETTPDTPKEMPAEKPASRSSAAEREAAKRALLSDPKKQDAKPNPLLDSRGPDFYDRRAKGLLEHEYGDVELHPLMQAHPGDFVVVCTGGCSKGKSAEIVSILPKRAAPADAGSSEPSENAAPQITCVGGCGPRGPSAMDAAPAPAADTPVAATVGEWMTTVATVPAGASDPMPKSAGGSGEWMEKIQQDRIAAQSKPVTIPAPSNVEAAPATQVAVPSQSPPEARPETKQAIAATGVPAVEAKPVAPSPAVPVAKPDTVAQTVAPGPATPSVEAQTKPAQTVVATEPSQTAAPASADTKPDLQQMAALNTAQPPAAAASSTPPAATSTTPQQSSDAVPPPAGQSTPRTGEAVAAVSPPAAEKPAAAVPPAAPKDGVISVLSEDKDMNAAIEKARASIGVFWKSYDGPAANETDHALKVAISGNGTTEHFWLTRIRREGDKLSGVISNRPQSVTSVKLGQRYEFTAETVSDWTFKRNGKLVGNETMRALLPRMPQEQAAVYRQMYETP
jgi:uncharacterized protein YegJ (DUF2314 family)